MLIHIIRNDNHYDYVKDYMLDRLIESHGIVKFKRTSGWVTLGEDLVRGCMRDSIFCGTDRRAVK
jgi:hypothetical protein